jgi:uncharacterized membrane protein
MSSDTEIAIVTFDDMEKAKDVLASLKHMEKEELVELEDAVVIVKDEHGKIKVKETKDLTTGKGAAKGGIVGLVISFLLGGPIGGVLLGSLAGALVGKSIDLGVSKEKVEAISESMADASSALLVQIKSGNKDALAAMLRKSGGELHEVSVTQQVAAEVSDVAAQAQRTTGGMDHFT